VRFPTDEEWVDRQRRRKIIIKQLGRGISETVVPSSEGGDAELLSKLRVGEGQEVDAYEASRILEQLGQADVDDVIPEAGAFRCCCGCQVESQPTFFGCPMPRM
jgi:hypothetical protein